MCKPLASACRACVRTCMRPCVCLSRTHDIEAVTDVRLFAERMRLDQGAASAGEGACAGSLRLRGTRARARARKHTCAADTIKSARGRSGLGSRAVMIIG